MPELIYQEQLVTPRLVTVENWFCLWWKATLLKRLPWQATFSTHLTGIGFFSAFFLHNRDVPLSPASTDWELNQQWENGTKMCPPSLNVRFDPKRESVLTRLKRQIKLKRGWTWMNEVCRQGEEECESGRWMRRRFLMRRCKASSSHLAPSPPRLIIPSISNVVVTRRYAALQPLNSRPHLYMIFTLGTGKAGVFLLLARGGDDLFMAFSKYQASARLGMN